jgi:ABC-type phosphate transport system substrate-binding protein
MKNTKIFLPTKGDAVRILHLVLLVAGFLMFAGIGAGAANLKVIAHPDVTGDSISAEDLKDIFLQSKSSLRGITVKPVLEKGGATHDAFLKEYLGKTDAALQTYYRSLVFTGKAAMPKALGSDAEVIAYVARTKGAIGYVSSATATEGVKTLAVK